MSDEIYGVAVMVRLPVPAHQHELYFQWRRGDKTGAHHIPIRPEGSPKTRPCEWEYKVMGDTLHVRPSVRIFGGADGAESFHNTAAWSVRFVDWDASAFPLGDCGLGPYNQLRVVNQPNPAPHWHD